MKIFVIWLILVIIWNYGYPNASPLEDVIVALILSLFSAVLKKYLKI
tara:strand:+ start:102 stop:242 length:141 start_codon:yes stop_codon:yes gene_type:complete